MNSNARPAPRFDDLDREEFQKMFESAAFKRFEGRVNDMLRRTQEDAERLDSELDVRRAQGGAKALRAVLNMPAIMLDEMQRRK